MNNDFIYDLETYPNVFTLAVEHATSPLTWSFEISDRVNDSAKIIEFLTYLKNSNARMVGFNNLGFDYPVLHTLIRMGRSDAKTLYDKAQAIITSQDDEMNKWQHQVYESDRFVEQIDLYKIHHFDNRARATGLKMIEFNMRADNIQDLPFPVGSILNDEQIHILKKYNAHDVTMTKKFYIETLPMIRFREELTHKYQRDFMNHNDTKIGKDYFIMKLEEAGVACYNFGQEGRTPRQTRRKEIVLKDAILPRIEFKNSEFQRVLNWLKEQRITETKGVFKKLEATINGFTFVFGTGGIHGSVENQVVESDNENIIIDWDVSSYYPNLAIQNRLYPEHLGESFCDIYKYLYDQRKFYPKGSSENAMLKLALNGVFGDSNSPFSVFYDPLFTMSITLNGQLLLCMLAEQLIEIGVTPQSINTDGICFRCHKSQLIRALEIRREWEQLTKLEIEGVDYNRMFISDVNSFLGETKDGKLKRKGRFEYNLGWHQNHSALVVPKVAEKVLLEGVGIRETLESWSDKMDFMLRVKVPRGSYLTGESDDQQAQLQRITRYYVAKNGVKLFKWMPPLETWKEWRKMSVEAGWTVQVCNDINDAELPIDYDYYQQEVEKLCLNLS